MSSENTKAFSKYRLEKAKDTLKSAKLLYDNNDFIGANNRAYYSIFYAIRAVLALEKIDFKELSDFINECTESVFDYFLIILIMDSIRDLVTLDEVFEVIMNFNTIRNNLDEKITEYEAILERERLLKGDFSKEKAMQKQEVEYSNVQNGYEFEEYVANLYRKLGYTIEEVTKKSGDQRS